MILEENKIYTNAEMAQWFKVTEKTFRNSRKKKLEILKEYCNFEDLRGKIKIIAIYDKTIPCEYIEKKSKFYEYCKEQALAVWKIEEPETVSRVAYLIFDEKQKRSLETVKTYVADIRNNTWGKPSIANPQCQYVLAKMWRLEEGYAQYELLNEEDYKILSEIHKQHFPTLEDKIELTKIQSMVNKNELTKEQAWDVVFNQKERYKTYIQALSNAFKCDWVVRATLVTPSAFSVNE